MQKETLQVTTRVTDLDAIFEADRSDWQQTRYESAFMCLAEIRGMTKWRIAELVSEAFKKFGRQPWIAVHLNMQPATVSLYAYVYESLVSRGYVYDGYFSFSVLIRVISRSNRLKYDPILILENLENLGINTITHVDRYLVELGKKAQNNPDQSFEPLELEEVNSYDSEPKKDEFERLKPQSDDETVDPEYFDDSLTLVKPKAKFMFQAYNRKYRLVLDESLLELLDTDQLIQDLKDLSILI